MAKDQNAVEKLLGGDTDVTKTATDTTKAEPKLIQRSMNDQESVEQAAFELYKHRSLGRANDSLIARQCFKSAETFAEALQKFRNGEFIVNTEFQALEDFTCPNQPKNHPHNLISIELGNINVVIEINKVLQDNPTMKKYDANNWDEPTTNIARNIFPLIVDRYKKAQLNAASSN